MARQAQPAVVAALEDVRALQVHLHKAILKENRGLMPMSCFAQISIGSNVLRSKTHNYCGTSPLWDEPVHLYVLAVEIGSDDSLSDMSC